MNNKIKELADQAGFGLRRDGEIYTSRLEHLPITEDLAKFAELIVRECANHCDLLLDHKISSEWSRGTHDCSRAIKKHFGVEE